MTRAIRWLFVLTLPTLFVWLSVGFVLWNWNPETWSEAARAAYVFFSVFFTLLAVGLFGDFT